MKDVEKIRKEVVRQMTEHSNRKSVEGIISCNALNHILVFIDSLPQEENQAEQQSELLDKKVTELNLSVRTTNICLSNGLNTVRDICRISKTDWLKFRNGGHKSLSEIDTFLKDNGLDWGMNN